MKIWLYRGGQRLAGHSGIGKAFEHQKQALDQAGVAYTMESEGADILQVNTIFPDTLWAVRKAKKRGMKVVYYAHSTEADFRDSFLGSNLLSGLFRRWISYCYRHGDVIVTPTDYSARILETYKLGRPIHAISNGIRMSEYCRENYPKDYFSRKFGFPKDKKVMMSVGHFFVRKGILDFIRMAEIMPECEFVWFGWTERRLCSREVREAMKEAPTNVHFPGFVNGEELKQAYASCDLFCFLTKEETEGIVMLEAMAMKCPILIRDIPIYEDLIEGVDVYKGKNIEEFAAAAKAISGGQRPDLTDSAFRYCQKKDIFQIAGQLRLLYNSFSPC